MGSSWSSIAEMEKFRNYTKNPQRSEEHLCFLAAADSGTALGTLSALFQLGFNTIFKVVSSLSR